MSCRPDLAPEDALLVDCAGEDDEDDPPDEPPDDPPIDGLEEEPPPPPMLGALGVDGREGAGEEVAGTGGAYPAV